MQAQSLVRIKRDDSHL